MDDLTEVMPGPEDWRNWALLTLQTRRLQFRLANNQEVGRWGPTCRAGGHAFRLRIATAGMNPLVHYVVHGGFQGRDPHPLFDTSWYLFDTSWYLERYPDVAAAGINPFIHYIAHGVSEGRQPGPLFSGPDDWEMDRGAAAAARAKYDWARRCRKSQVPVSIAY